ncbi:unnamed protein product, partial [marine sediment metagenome]
MITNYDVNWIKVSVDEMKNRRAVCKIEQVCSGTQELDDGDKLMVSDVDVIFLDNPFTVFTGSYDLGVTSRGYPYYFDINAGVFFLYVSPKIRSLMG